MKGLFCIKYITILNDNCKKKYGRRLFVLSSTYSILRKKELASETQKKFVHETDKHKAFMTSPEAGADLQLKCFFVLQRKQPWNVVD